MVCQRWLLLVALMGVLVMPASALKVVIHNPNNYPLTDYQVRIDLSRYLSAPTYLKVTDASGKILPFTYEQPNGECGLNPTTVIWVKVPYIPANGDTTIYVETSSMNYAVKGDKVFLFYDDFNEGYLNTSKWFVFGKDIKICNGKLILDNQGIIGNGSFVSSIQSLSVSTIVEAKGGTIGMGYSTKIERGRTVLRVSNSLTSDPGISAISVVEDVDNNRIFVNYYNGHWHDYDLCYPKLKVNELHLFKIVILSTQAIGAWDTYYRIIPYTLTSYHIHLLAHFDTISEFDWVRVRKYADTEPTVTIEAEAPQPIPTTPYYPPQPGKPSKYQPPVAVITPHTIKVYQGQTVTLSALASYDPNPNGRIVIYQWTDENGNILSNSPILRYTFPVGTHTITLRVTNNYGLSATDTATVEVLQKQVGIPAIVVSQSSLNPANGLLVVSVVNTGDAPAYDVRVMERIPSEIIVSYVEGATSSGGLVIWSGDLQPSQEHTIRHSIKMMTNQAIIPVTVKYKDPKGVEHEIMTTLFINATVKQKPTTSALPISEQTLIVLVAIIVVGIVAIVVAMRRKPPKIEVKE